MSVQRVVVYTFACLLFAHPVLAQSPAPAPKSLIPEDDRLNAVLWTMSSAEFDASSRMAFVMARTALDAALANPTHSAALEQTGDVSGLPPAIIVDVDETILDNGPYQVRLMRETKIRPADLMSIWVEEASAKALPGAAEFVAYAQSKGVTIFYITNRNSEKEAATRKNLAAIGATFPENIDTVLLEFEKPEWRGDKTSRRAFAASTHRILLVIGDDFNDFVSARTSLADRRTVAAREASRWGRDWIMIPNPMYGSWEGASINFNFRAPPDERRRMKHDLLDALEAAN